MKDIIKKSMCIVLAAAVLAATGCEKNTAKETGGNTAKITVWSGASHSKDFYGNVIDEYNKHEGKEKGIEIEYMVKGGDTLDQSIEIALQSGDAPHLLGGGNMMKMAENGYILPIEEMPGGEEFLKKYEGRLVKDKNVYNGKTYSVPFGATTQGLLYNKEMFKKAGIVDSKGRAKPPETFAEMREDAKKLTNASKNEYGIILPMKWAGWFSSDILCPMMNSAGHLGYDPVSGRYDYTPLEAIMEAYLGMKKDKSIFPGAESIDNDSARAYFAAGGIGMKMGYSFDVGVLNTQFPAEINWGVAPYPFTDKDAKYKQRMSYGTSFVINAKKAEQIGKDKVMEALKFFNSDEMTKKLYQAGIEIPYDWNIVKDVELTNARKGWKEFCKIVSISSVAPPSAKLDMAGQRDISDIFINDIWSGKMNAKTALERYTQTANKACDKYYAENAAEDRKLTVNPDWDIKR